MNTNRKLKIWVYAVILFTSAFIVLLFTAYSQIKMNKNLNDYKNQIYNKETEKNKYQQNFSSAQEMNSRLNEEIKTLQEENNVLKANINDLEKNMENIEEILKLKSSAAEGLSKAITEYLNGNVVVCAGLIKNIDSANLDEKAVETYKVLLLKANAEAGKLLFDEGYALYNRAKYSEAVEKLLLSSQYAPADNFSDKCLFYLAYSEVKSSNTTGALDHMNKLINNYPSSKYLKSAKRFIEKYKQ